jgi:hypothetical protein
MSMAEQRARKQTVRYQPGDDCMDTRSETIIRYVHETIKKKLNCPRRNFTSREKIRQRERFLELIWFTFGYLAIRVFLLDSEKLDQVIYNRDRGLNTNTTVVQRNEDDYRNQKYIKKSKEIDNLELINDEAINYFKQERSFDAIFLDFMNYPYSKEKPSCMDCIKLVLRNNQSQVLVLGITLSEARGKCKIKKSHDQVSADLEQLFRINGYEIQKNASDPIKDDKSYRNGDEGGPGGWTMCCRFYVLKRISIKNRIFIDLVSDDYCNFIDLVSDDTNTKSDPMDLSD